MALVNPRIGDHRLYWVSQPDLALVRAQDLVPHIILVDDALGGADPIPLIRQLTSSVPVAATIAMVAEDAMNEARQAVLVGARSFVAKPSLDEELVPTLLQVFAWQRLPTVEAKPVEKALGYTVAFCAPKGGTGRTTMAINTAVGLWQVTQKPLVLVDADYAAPALDVALNLRSDRNIADLLPKLSRLDEDLISSVLVQHASGLNVLLAPPPADLSSPLSLMQVQHILVMLKRMFPWVIVDLGLPLDETTFAFLDGADRIIMSVLPEMVGLRNTRLMLDQLFARGYPDDKVWLVLNRATLRGGVSQRDIETRLRVSIKFTIPDDQALATHSINRGVPIVISHPRSAVARSVQRLARQLCADLPLTDAGEFSTRPSLLRED
jgi:pilus assembly protein CpaE